MSESSTGNGKHTSPLLWSLSVFLFAIEEVILIPGLAAFLVACLLSACGLPERMTPLAWLVAAPVLYCLWVLAYLSICALHIQALFWKYSKPRHAVIVDASRESAPHVRLGICYGRAYMVKSLPFMQSLITLPSLRNLYLLSYSPSIKIGKRFVLAGFLYDPDLIEIGDDVIVGGGCVMAAHAHVVLRSNVQLYVSAPIRICDRATVGGESRIAMGVTIGSGAVVESYSNVVALTNIGPGEVWGGSPAVLLRRRTDLVAGDGAAQAVPRGRSASDAAKVGSDCGPLDRARRVVARALDQAVDAVSTEDWDSLQQLAIALAVEEECGQRPIGDQIFEMRTLGDVARALGDAVASAPPADADSANGHSADPEWLPLLPFSAAAPLSTGGHAPVFVGEPFPVVVAASFSADPLAASLRQWGGAFGIDVRVQFAVIDQIAHALRTPDSLLRDNASGLNVVLVRPEDLGDSPDARAAAADELLSAIRHFATERGASARLAVGSLPPLVAAGAERQACEALQSEWVRQLSEIDGVEVLDFGEVVERIGTMPHGNGTPPGTCRAAYSGEIFHELGVELARVVRRRRRPPAKVVALDCDGVLWGGALAEDGFDGIRLGAKGAGRSFQSFQRKLLDLKQQGVLLVVVSQNDEPDVFDVFDKHSGMILRRQDIAAWRLNWNAKSENLQELADELNVALDSLIYIDADPAQRQEVESHLPAVHVFPTPAEPVQFASALSRLWIFDAPHATPAGGGHSELSHANNGATTASRGR